MSEWVVGSRVFDGLLLGTLDNGESKESLTSSKIKRVKKENGKLYVVTKSGSVYELTGNGEFAIGTLKNYLEGKLSGMDIDLNKEEFEYIIP